VSPKKKFLKIFVIEMKNFYHVKFYGDVLIFEANVEVTKCGQNFNA